MIRVKEKCFETHEANVAWVLLVYGPLCRTVVVDNIGSYTSVCEAVQRVNPPRDVAIGLERSGWIRPSKTGEGPEHVRLPEANLPSFSNEAP